MTDAVSTEGIFSGLALWLVPATSSGFTDAVGEEMGRLREVNRGVCSGEFGIHATLLAGLGGREVDGEGLRDVVVEAVRVWKKDRRGEGGGLTVGLQDVTTRGSYFQCILISLTSSPPLLSLHQTTRHLVNHHFPPTPSSSSSSPEHYFPHISLLYASLTPSQTSQQITQMRQNGTFSPHNDGINFKGFTQVQFESIDVYDCTGRPQDWVKLHSVPL